MEDNPLAPAASDAPEVSTATDNAAVNDQQPQTADAAVSTDNQKEEDEWDAAADTVFPNLKSANKQGADDEQEQPEETSQKQETPAANKAGEAADDGADSSKGQPNEADKDGEGADEASEEDEQVDTSARDARVAQRQYAEQQEAVKNDIISTLYADRQTELRDHDGDPIRTVEDVMKLINPATVGSEDAPNGRAFTHEEAGLWLLQNSSALNKQIAEQDREIDRITDLQLDIKDQADSIKDRYAPLLEADPTMRDQLWADFIALCETKTGKGPDGKDVTIITKMPKIGLEKFYERALEPLAVVGRRLEAAEQQQQDTTAQVRATQEQTRQQQRQDRSDIYGGGGADTRDDDTKEWDAAAAAVFTPEQLNRFKK